MATEHLLDLPDSPNDLRVIVDGMPGIRDYRMVRARGEVDFALDGPVVRIVFDKLPIVGRGDKGVWVKVGVRRNGTAIHKFILHDPQGEGLNLDHRYAYRDPKDALADFRNRVLRGRSSAQADALRSEYILRALERMTG